MANLAESAIWEPGVYQLENTDPVVGGEPNLAQAEGFDNIPHQMLANRTVWLKQQVDTLNGNYVTQADIDAAIAALIDGAPGALNTLNELAEALGDDANFAATIANALYGVGQTWQDMTASRTTDTIYQNTTGKPISVCIQGRATGASVQRPIEISPDQSAWLEVSSLKHQNSDNTRVTITIPDGIYYRVVGAANINNWTELR